MSELFARVYLDEDVSVLIATLLRSRGFEAFTTQQMGNIAASDSFQLDYSARHELALLTHNRADFEELAQEYFKEGRHHAGIIIAVRRQPRDLLGRLLVLLNQTSTDELADNVWYV